MKSPLLSVIIPTRNRSVYLKRAVENILKNCPEDTEIIIQDNSDSTELAGAFCANTIKYFYSPRELSFASNFEAGLKNCTGQYICFIGDDDGVLPSFLKVVQYMKRFDIDALLPTKNPPSYLWPNGDDSGWGKLTVPAVSNAFHWYHTKDEVKKLSANGYLDYLSFGLAKCYHGIVSRRSFERAIRHNGHCFNGLSPDIYSAIALSCQIDRVLEIGFPLTIAGVCPDSGSGAAVKHKHEGKLEEAPHWRGNQGYIWQSEIPYFYSVETIWAESALKGLKESGCYDGTFNKERLVFRCMKEHKNQKILLKKYCRERNINPIVVQYQGISDYLNRAMRKVGKPVKPRIMHDVANIDAAAELVSKITDAAVPSIDDFFLALKMPHAS